MDLYGRKNMRATGVLLPIASLPTKYGIGGFSKEAYDFVDWLKAAGVDYWQILPLGPTGYGDSPYQSISTFAGNPYFIDLEALTEEGLLTKEECAEALRVRRAGVLQCPWHEPQHRQQASQCRGWNARRTVHPKLPPEHGQGTALFENR